MESVSYDSIRTQNEEDTQTFTFKSAKAHSADDLRTTMNKIGTNIAGVNTNWQSRVSSIQQIGSFIAGGILRSNLAEDFISLLLHIRDGICRQVTELRSGVSKEIFRVLSLLAITVDESAKHLLSAIQPFMDYVVPYILKQVKHTILAISHPSNIALRTICKRIPLHKCLSHVVQNTSASAQKSVCLRVRCLECVRIMIETQSYHGHALQRAHSEVLASMVEAVQRCIGDPHPSVRFVARQCVWSLAHSFAAQKFAEGILAQCSPQNAKRVLSEQSAHELFPPPIGTGHRVDLANYQKTLKSRENGRGLTSSASTASLLSGPQRGNGNGMGANVQKGPIRPRSALPSRKDRLELLKKRKKDQGRKSVILKRPQTAVGLTSAPLRIHENVHAQTKNSNDADLDIDERIRKISIRGTATRTLQRTPPKETREMREIPKCAKMQRTPPKNLPMKTKAMAMPKAQRMSIESATSNSNEQEKSDSAQGLERSRRLDEILCRVQEQSAQGITALRAWLRVIERTDTAMSAETASRMVRAVGGYLDAMTADDASWRAMFECLSVLFSPHPLIALSAEHIYFLVSAVLSALRLSTDARDYAPKRDLLQRMCHDLHRGQCHVFSLCELLKRQSNSKSSDSSAVWLCFAARYCAEVMNPFNGEPSTAESAKDWDAEGLRRLCALLCHCVSGSVWLRFHALFGSAQCSAVNDIVEFLLIRHAQRSAEIIAAQLSDALIETLLGMVRNENVARILQTHYSRTSTSMSQSSSVISAVPKKSMFTTPAHQNRRYHSIRKQQIESMATPPLNMYMSTPALTNHGLTGDAVPCSEVSKVLSEKTVKVQMMGRLDDAQLVSLLLNGVRSGLSLISNSEMKGVLKSVAHRMNGSRAAISAQSGQILNAVISVINSDAFALHRNALRLLQALCWFYAQSVNAEVERTLHCIVNLFRASAPTESGELALDVITQFCKIVERAQCIECLVALLKAEVEVSKARTGKGANENGRKVFAALSIFDRILVTAPKKWLRERANAFASLLLDAYHFHREPMRSLIYLSILLDGDTAFLGAHHQKEQKIVQMMAKEADFADWVKSHRAGAQ